MGNRQWAMGNGQWGMGNGEDREDPLRLTLIGTSPGGPGEEKGMAFLYGTEPIRHGLGRCSVETN